MEMISKFIADPAGEIIIDLAETIQKIDALISTKVARGLLAADRQFPQKSDYISVDDLVGMVRVI